MAAVEALDDLLHQVRRLHVDAVERHVDLEDLLAVAHVDRAAARRTGPSNDVREPAPPLRLHLGEQPPQTPGRRAGRRRRYGCATNSKRRSVASMPQADSTAATRGTMTRAELELARDVGDVQPGRAAEGEQREAARIDAAAHRDQPHALGHVGVDDAVDALAPPPPRSMPSAARDARRRRARRPPRSSRASPPRKSVGVEIAEHEVGVGHGGRGAAAAVAGRARAPRRRSPARHAGCRPHRPARSSRRRRRGWRCRGCAARPLSADRRVAGERAARRPRAARCRCWCRPCRTGSGCRRRAAARRDGCRRRRPPGPDSTRAGGEPHRLGDRGDAAMRLDDQHGRRGSPPSAAARRAGRDSARAPGPT